MAICQLDQTNGVDFIEILFETPYLYQIKHILNCHLYCTLLRFTQTLTMGTFWAKVHAWRVFHNLHTLIHFTKNLGAPKYNFESFYFCSYSHYDPIQSQFCTCHDWECKLLNFLWNESKGFMYNLWFWRQAILLHKVCRLLLCHWRVPEYYVKIKRHLRHENKVSQNKVLSFCEI